MAVSLSKGTNVSLTKEAPNAYARVIDDATGKELAL